MEHIRAPEFGVITKIKKLEIEIKQADRVNRFMESMLALLATTVVVFTLYNFVTFIIPK